MDINYAKVINPMHVREREKETGKRKKNLCREKNIGSKKKK